MFLAMATVLVLTFIRSLNDALFVQSKERQWRYLTFDMFTVKKTFYQLLVSHIRQQQSVKKGPINNLF